MPNASIYPSLCNQPKTGERTKSSVSGRRTRVWAVTSVNAWRQTCAFGVTSSFPRSSRSQQSARWLRAPSSRLQPLRRPRAPLSRSALRPTRQSRTDKLGPRQRPVADSLNRRRAAYFWPSTRQKNSPRERLNFFAARESRACRRDHSGCFRPRGSRLASSTRESLF